jgi:hypothetical protein
VKFSARELVLVGSVLDSGVPRGGGPGVHGPPLLADGMLFLTA